ncbi:hypothetical protein [Teichococcus aestuarii]|uniref:Uncharacterized protein n=1 Tax=Teichococcus aestuarii TaxID=568898 RepID=A0A2U1UYC8_9PROT|nr:hypothetical protein [Pseudoroseomonas aestuarii]PWC26650.1 hypothetical protein CR165_22170 [Pseudoroseomonas aestuarii]
MAADLTIDGALLRALADHSTWFHATLAGPGIRSFIGMHWGSRAPALARLHDVLDLPEAARPWGMPEGPGQPTLYEAEIRTQKPLEIADGLHEVDHLVGEFLSRGIIGQAQATAMLDRELESFDVLQAHDIDAIVYRNTHEDPGSLSIVPLTQGVIRLTGVTAIIDTGIERLAQ